MLQKCRDPGSNRGPLDLQSNALPTELSRPDENELAFPFSAGGDEVLSLGKKKKVASAGNRTRINCLEGSYADHYTTDASGGQIWHLRDTSCKCMKLVLDVSDYLKVAVSNIYFQDVL